MFCHVTRFPSIQSRDGQSSNLQSVAADPAIIMGDELCNAVDLAKKALSASKEASSVSDSMLSSTGFDNSIFPRYFFFSNLLLGQPFFKILTTFNVFIVPSLAWRRQIHLINRKKKLKQSDQVGS